jgi:hypothetical protein
MSRSAGAKARSRWQSLRRVWLAIAVITLACLPSTSRAAESLQLKVAFAPYRLGSSTTINTFFAVRTSNGQLPPPPIKFVLRFPASLTGLTSNLGLAICHPGSLEGKGVKGCSPNSRIGTGRASVTVPIGPEPVSEEAYLFALMGPPQGEQIGVLLYAEARTPVSAESLFQGELLSGSRNFGELLETNVPLIPTLPGAGDATVTWLQLSIDPPGLTYYKRARGRWVGYHPRGFELPARCPRGGFRFSVNVSFADGSTSSTAATVPCQTRAHRRHHRRARRSR